jgi:hypothetical protein
VSFFINGPLKAAFLCVMEKKKAAINKAPLLGVVDARFPVIAHHRCAHDTPYTVWAPHRAYQFHGQSYENQQGFRGLRGCIGAAFNLRTHLRKRQEHGHDTWVAFLDLVKAFDTTSREMLWGMLCKLGCPRRFVNRIKAPHGTVIILLKRGDSEIRCPSYGGVRQGDILGPPLFNLYMAAVSLTFKKLKTTADCDVLTCTTGFVIHGVPRKTTGDDVTVNEQLCADDTALMNRTREDLADDLKLLSAHFVDFGMLMHEGAPGKESKTEAMYIARQRARHVDYSTFDGADRSAIALGDCDVFADLTTYNDRRTPGRRLIPFVKRFCYLGSIIDETLNDEEDVSNRILKAPSTFGRCRNEFFARADVPERRGDDFTLHL